ncbi:hypothetical protein V9J82_003661 [Vibrio cholerae]|nr:hypothetical protein [Vibrio cholerae]GHY60286.1 hypothetical protein VCSRO24_3623 [Vibrio cholerae]
MSQLKFLDNPIFMDDTFEALSSQFSDKQDFLDFYNSLPDDKTKDDFLRVGTDYLFFVKSGDWHVDVKRSSPIVSYFTNSFKLVSLLSIIEGLESTKHLEFFDWLNKKENKDIFPIDRKELDGHYRKYKQEHGSISNVVSFFKNLSSNTQERLRSHVTIDDVPIESTELLVKFIYHVRSKFAHSTTHTLEIGDVNHYSKHQGNLMVWRKFTMGVLLSAVEEGIIIHFRNRGQKI